MAKGGLPLGKRTKEFSGYTLKESMDGTIILEPLIGSPRVRRGFIRTKKHWPASSGNSKRQVKEKPNPWAPSQNTSGTTTPSNLTP